MPLNVSSDKQVFPVSSEPDGWLQQTFPCSPTGRLTELLQRVTVKMRHDLNARTSRQVIVPPYMPFFGSVIATHTVIFGDTNKDAFLHENITR